jgi:hypothetical protein
MPEQKITPSIQAMAYAIAGMVLATTALDASIRRGDVTPDEARDVISRARKLLKSYGDLKSHGNEKQPEEMRLVFQAAGEALQIAESFLAMAAAEKSPLGGH